MFDPYHKWLGIPKKYRPPTLYQILGIEEDEDDLEVIDEAAIRQSAHIRTYQTGPQSDLCTKLLNEISKARTVLLNPAKRKQYDVELEKRRPKKTEPPAVDKNDEANAVFADLGESPSLVSAHSSPSGRNLGGATPKRRTGVHLDESDAEAKKKKLIIIGIAGGAVVLLLAILIPVLMFGGGSEDPPEDKFAQVAPDEKPGPKDAKKINPKSVPPKPNPMPVPPNPNPNPPNPNPNPPNPNPNPNPEGRFILRPINPPAPTMESLTKVNQLEPRLPGTQLVNHLVLPGEREVILASRELFARYNLETKEQVGVYRKATAGLPHFNFFEIAPDGNTLYSLQMGEPVIRIWDLKAGQEVGQLQCQGSNYLNSFALSPDGRWAVCCDFRIFRIWDTKNRKEILRRDEMRYQGFMFTPDGQTLYAMGRDKIDIWDIERKSIKTINVPNHNFLKASTSPTGDVAVSFSSANTMHGVLVLRRNLADSVSFRTGDEICSLAFSPNGQHLVLGFRTGFVRIFRADHFHSSYRYEAHKGYIYRIQFSRDGKKLYTSGTAGFFKAWDFAKPADVAGNPSGLPTPKLALVGRRDVSANGEKIGTTYELGVDNWAEFKDEWFVPAEVTYPDGKKVMRRPLDLKFYTDEGRFITRKDALTSSALLRQFSRTYRDDGPTPSGIYVVVEDRRNGKTVKSNVVALRSTPTPVPVAKNPTPPGAIPTPKLSLVRVSDSILNGGKKATNYHFRVENWAEFDNDLFRIIDIVAENGAKLRRQILSLQVFSDTGHPVTGFSLSGKAKLQDFSSVVSQDDLQANGFYVVIYDIRDGKKYKSNIVTAPGGKYVPEGVTGRDPLPVFPYLYFKGHGIRTLALRAKQSLHLVAGTKVQSWNSATGKFKELSRAIGGSTSFAALAVSPKGTIAASSVMGERDIHIWNLAAQSIIRVCQGHSKEVKKVAFIDSGRQLLSASLDKSVRQWNVLTGQEIHRFPGYTEPVFGLAVSSDAKWFVTFDGGGMLRKWDLENRENVNSKRLLTRTSGTVMDISPDDKIIALADNRSLTLVDAETLTPLRRAIIPQGAQQSVRFSPNGKLLVTCGRDDFTCVWDAANLEELFRIHHIDDCCDAVFAPDSQTVFVCVYTGIHVAKLYESRDDFVAEVKTVYAREGNLSTARTFEVHDLKMEKGKTYIIDMNGRFAADLMLESARGIQLASDISFRVEARIIFKSPQTAVYRVIATSNSKRSVGRYDVKVQEIVVSPSKKAVAEEQPNGKSETTKPLDNSKQGNLLAGQPQQRHTFNLTAGRTYQIDMTAKFDAYLILQDAAGKRLAFDDDNGPGLNARLTFRAPTTASYHVIATYVGKKSTGPYKLQVTEKFAK